MKKKNETTTEAAKKLPVHKDRVGSVSCSVFLNSTKDGKQFPSAVISRSYKASDNTYKDSNSYGARHIAELAGLVGSLQAWFAANYPDAAK